MANICDDDDPLAGAIRLDELLTHRVASPVPEHRVTLSGLRDPKGVLVDIGGEEVGHWSRDGGTLVAHFKWAKPFRTKSVDEAVAHTTEVARHFVRIRNGAPPT